MYLWEIENEEGEVLIKWAREKYLHSILERDAAEQSYYDIVRTVITSKLLDKRIVSGKIVEIDFADGVCKCCYRGVSRGKIKYSLFTTKGKPGKTTQTTDWTMYEHMELLKGQDNE